MRSVFEQVRLLTSAARVDYWRTSRDWLVGSLASPSPPYVGGYKGGKLN
jgi:hypothetical protein